MFKPFYFGLFLAAVAIAVACLNFVGITITKEVFNPLFWGWLALGSLFFFHKRYSRSNVDSLNAISPEPITKSKRIFSFYVSLIILLLLWAGFFYMMQPRSFDNWAILLFLLFIILSFIPNTARKAGLAITDIRFGRSLFAVADTGRMILVFYLFYFAFNLIVLAHFLPVWGGNAPSVSNQSESNESRVSLSDPNEVQNIDERKDTSLVDLNSTAPMTLVVRVISPNGGEIYKIGSDLAIKWWDDRDAGNTDILITDLEHYGAEFSIADNEFSRASGIDGAYTKLWKISNIPSGKYKIRICKSSTKECDLSDNYFTVTQ